MNGDKTYSILIVDDEHANRTALLEILGDDYDLYLETNGMDAIEAATEHIPDIILLDIIMPDMDGYETITRLKNSEKSKDIPVIFITGLNDSDSEQKGLALGAADYIIKPFSPVTVELRIKNQIKMLEQLREIERFSMTDQLTRIANRRSFDIRFNAEWNRSQRERTPISILMLDIDRFKVYNDTNGHMQGDIALQSFARTFSETLKRPGDFAARWGGEEFTVLLPNTDIKGAVTIAEQIRKNIEEMRIPCADGRGEKVTVSIGVNTKLKEDKCTVDEFISGADEALYTAKAKGRNKSYHFSDNMNPDNVLPEENTALNTLPKNTELLTEGIHKDSILIVDDEQENRMVLFEILSGEYNIYLETNGFDAIEAAENTLPDLILLDILMPEINGYETLKRLKDSKKTTDIPVIFITGLRDTEDEKKGLALGAVDYITKPFSPGIVKLRIGNQINIVNQTREQVEKERIEKNNLAMIDFLIHDLMDLYGKKEGVFALEESGFYFNNMYMDILNTLERDAAKKQQKLTFYLDPAIPLPIIGDKERLAQVITNLMTNAVKFTPEYGVINFEARVLTSENISGTDKFPDTQNKQVTLQIEVTDSGIGIPKKKQKGIFNVFEQWERSKTGECNGTGLGLPISLRIVEMMGGKIWVESEPGQGSKFIFTCSLKK